MKLRVGVIGSSGGSALIASLQCLTNAGHFVEPVIVVDRDCGMARWGREQQFSVHQIDYCSPAEFSISANSFFKDHGCRHVLLFYTRRVTAPLIDELKVWNIHPALLPSFLGLDAVEQALQAKTRLLGATLHRVDEGLDTGAIISQTVAVLPADKPSSYAYRLSYVQKVWLTLDWFETITTSKQPKATTTQYGSSIGLATSDLNDIMLRKCFLEWSKQLDSEVMEKH